VFRKSEVKKNQVNTTRVEELAHFLVIDLNNVEIPSNQWRSLVLVLCSISYHVGSDKPITKKNFW
jgi:hypothetical protein